MLKSVRNTSGLIWLTIPGEKLDYRNITFLPLDIDVCAKTLATMSKEITQQKDGFWSDYRHCQIMPLYTPMGSMQRLDQYKKSEPFQWTPLAQQMPTTKDFLETEIFPWLSPIGRVFVLITPPGEEIPMHIDCGPNQWDKLQLKLRIVTQGDSQGLWFQGGDDHKVYPKPQRPIYVIDGSQPHGMINNSSESKYTICIGSPWCDSSPGHRFYQLLETSLAKFSNQTIFRHQVERRFQPDLFQRRP